MSKKLLIGLAVLGVGALATYLIVKDDAPSLDEPLEINPAFSEYITAFTSGTISAEGAVQVRLAEAREGEITFDEAIEKELFDFEPSIEGEAYWRDAQTIEFVPSEPMPSGAKFQANFDLEALVDVPDDLEDFIFRFQVIEQAFEVFVDGMSPYNNTEMNWQMVDGSINTADVIDDEVLEQVLKVTQDNSALSVKWDHEPNRKIHHFTIDSVKRKEIADNIFISWNGDNIGVPNQTDKINFEIPALGDFKLMSTEVVQQPDQYILLRFSDPLDQGQNLEGLIKVGDLSDLNFTIEANEIRVYPRSRQTGEHSITLDGSIRNVLGYKMDKEISESVVFEDIKPSVRLVGSGNILPSSDGLVFPFEAVNLWAVDVRIIQVYENNIAQFFQVNRIGGESEMKRVGRQLKKTTIRLSEQGGGTVDLGRWNRYYLDLEELISADPGAIYRVEIGFKQNYSTYPCEGGEGGEIPEMAELEETDWDAADAEEESSSWDYYEDYYDDYYYDDYDYYERDNPCHSAYYGERRNVARNILASDLGIIAKGNTDRSMEFAITDLKTTDPAANVTVEVYNYQQQLLGKINTDAEGKAKMPTLDNKPFLLIAKRGSERGYMRLDDGSSLSLSRFDVAGTRIDKGLKGFIYGERGVWRPGDSLYLSFILEDKDMILPSAHPVSFELLNPQGQVTQKIMRTHPTGDFYNFNTLTASTAPTGNWEARVRVGGTVFRKNLKVEMVRPNRLKILLDFGKEMLSYANQELQGSLDVKWLHGAIAKNLRANIAVTLSAVPTTFPKYTDYVFDDPARRFDADEEIIFDSEVDENGHADIPASIEVYDAAPGMLKANFKCRVFEESGEFSTDRFSMPFSPYESYVGVKLPKGDKARGMLLTDVEHPVKIVTVDEDGKPVARKDVEVVVYKVDWRWWWEKGDDDLTSYNTREHYSVVAEGTASTGSNGAGEFKFQVNYPDWGRYLVRAVDPVSGHATGKVVYIDWPGWAGRAQSDNPGGASMLLFTADKKKYEVGETVNLTFPSSGAGRALVSIENGTRVVESHWVDAAEKETHFSFKVKPDMAPNVFINVTLLQPHNQTANDLPIRLYGVIPIEVEDPDTHLYPVIDMPDVLAPEKPVSITVSEENGNSMVYTVAVVDEGLLDLTRFKTPDPWKHFYSREALGVKTWDMYDDVIGAYGSQLEHLLSIGGDDEGGASAKKGGNSANRFKPMVKFMGPFKLEKGKKTTHTFTMPKYIGSVRTMVVAGENGAYGNAEKATPVRTPLMVLATLPRVIGPGESVSLPVSVFAMENKVKNVSVEVQTNDLFSAESSPKKSIVFSRPGDEVVNFQLKAAEATGVAKVKVIAKSGNERAEYEIEIDVRNPNPRVTEVVEGLAQGGQNLSKPFTPPGISGTNHLVLEVSAIPAMDLSRRLKYLVQYPHGCVEQTTSSVFPQLFVGDVIELDDRMQKDITRNVKAGIQRLKGFQRNSGGFSYWPGDQEVSAWGTTYAGHFILEAERKGYTIPSGMKNSWIKYQRRAARDWKKKSRYSSGYYRLDDLEQAYRLYTLALANKPELGAMNRLKEQDDLSVQAKWRLAAAYQMAGRPEVAKKLTAGISTTLPSYKEMGNTYGSDVRDLAMIIETLSITENREKAAPLVKQLSGRMRSKEWLSTQTTAYALIAVTKFVHQYEGDKSIRFTASIDGKEVSKQSMKPVVRIDIDRTTAKAGTLKFNNQGKTVLYARLIMDGIPKAGEETSSSNGLSLDIVYKDLDYNTIDITDLEQGTDFMAEVTVKHPGGGNDYQEMALNQIFPPGWEIRNLRLDGSQSNWMKDKPEYMDIRDDRVMQYFDLDKGESKTFRVLLNASYVGEYYLPAVSCEAMYDHTINAREKGQWVRVSMPGGEAMNNE